MRMLKLSCFEPLLSKTHVNKTELCRRMQNRDNTAGTNLVIDIGNTRAKAAVFQNEKMVCREVWTAFSKNDLIGFAYNHNVGNVILSSTAKVPEWTAAFLKEHRFSLELTNQTPLPIGIQYATPKTLGRDRIAAAVGAWAEYPSENVLVVDAGTCITMDVLSAEGHFLGGNISPGIGMRLKAMHHFTAKLPLLEPNNSPLPTSGWIGGSTEEAIRNGGELGALLEVKGFIAFCRRRFRPLRIVFTGGDAYFFVRNLKTKIFAHQNLVLSGLNQILLFNVKQFERF